MDISLSCVYICVLQRSTLEEENASLQAQVCELEQKLEAESRRNRELQQEVNVMSAVRNLIDRTNPRP